MYVDTRVASSIWLPFKFPHLNAIILEASTVRKVKTRTGKEVQVSKYTETKHRWTSIIKAWARQKGFEVLPGCWNFTYLCVDDTKRKDPGNILAGAVKIIEDALVDASIMENDGWGQVNSIHGYFAHTKLSKTHGLNKPGVCLSIGPELPTESEMLEVARILSSNVPSLRTQQREKAALKAQLGASSDSPDSEGAGGSVAQ